jgi:cbb3-type cytochrome oxidase subunit 3
VHWGTVGPSLIFYAGLLFVLSLSIGAAVKFHDTPYFTEWVAASVALSIGAVWCGALIWWRRRRDQPTIFEICLAMFSSMAVKDSVVYWQNGEDAFLPLLMWFCVLGYVFMLVYSMFAKKRAETPAPSVDLAMQLDDDPQALLKHRDTRNAAEPQNP